MANILSRWLKPKNDPADLSDINAALARLDRDQQAAAERAERGLAETAALIAAGADDAAIDEAERRHKLAEREVARCKAARPELLAQKTAFQAAERAALRVKLRQELLEAGREHRLTAWAANRTGAKYVAARYALETAGFGADAGVFPFLPLSTVDLSSHKQAVPDFDRHSELESFDFSLAKAELHFVKDAA